jgi:hypothetical protein
MRRAADALRVGLLCAAAAALTAGDTVVAAKVLLILPAVAVPRLFAVHPALDLLFSSALAVEALGSGLAAHELIGWGDRGSHLVLPLLCGLVIYDALRPRLASKRPLAAGTATGLAVFAVGALWEVVEWLADALLDTNFSMGRADTVGDISADTVAAAGAGVLAAASHSARGRFLGGSGSAA